MYIQALLCAFLVGYAVSQEYTDDHDQEAREQQVAPNYAHHGYNNDIYETAPSEPYDFGFQSTDEFGTIMNRQESSDSRGAVRGSYGYTDPHGVFRHVDYVADEYGFRAEVKSNEPGMGTASPANVQIYAEPPPVGVIVERAYTPYQPGQNVQGGQQGSRRNPSTAASNSNANRQARPTATRIPVASNTRTAVYPYIPPQQNAISSNALGGSQYQPTASNQYPSTVSSQYAANAAASSASSNQYGSEYQASSATSNSQYGQAASANGFHDSRHQGSAGNQYGSGHQGASGSQYGSGHQGASGSQYGSGYQGASGSQYGSGYQGGSGSQGYQYPARGAYASQGYAAQSSTVVRSTSGSSASATNQPIVPKPYDGPTYKIGNPHVTELVKPERKESGSILLPTLVTGGSPTTLVKHIYTHPVAPVA